MRFWPTCKTTAAVVITTIVLLVAAYNLFDYWPTASRSINVPVSQMTPQQLASHMLIYLDRNGAETGVCTGTAIGPHAVLTASHCNNGAYARPSFSIKLDYSDVVFNIRSTSTDGRDHEIYLLTGPALKNTVPYIPASFTLVGEHITYYGFGEAVYPSTVRQGHLRPNDDPSDVDAASEFYTFDFPAIHGDSGSAIYDDQDRIVGLVTYVLPWYGHECMGAFALNFAPEKIHTAQTFDPLIPTVIQ